MRVLVTGGAGYIGSHTVIRLVQAGHDVIVADNFSNSKPSVIPRIEAILGSKLALHTVDIADAELTCELIGAEQVEAVIHFAGFKAVGESVQKQTLHREPRQRWTCNALSEE
ncbi:GDP-mannose 4,6-dehydratase [Pedococcus sp. 5OH_020]|uniref:GDP-mannose 4,6-dehydratase n=1 Tax=Pedococcus sp. 5OH_020 TaxID=2989814 RepID=UPI0022E9CD3F|nr:GDP-mannose 4,6-dehydratase [Pedococcus sp. 5OH_020]